MSQFENISHTLKNYESILSNSPLQSSLDRMRELSSIGTTASEMLNPIDLGINSFSENFEALANGINPLEIDKISSYEAMLGNSHPFQSHLDKIQEFSSIGMTASEMINPMDWGINSFSESFEALTKGVNPLEIDKISSYEAILGNSHPFQSHLDKIQEFSSFEAITSDILNPIDLEISTVLGDLQKSNNLYEELFETFSKEPLSVLNPNYKPSQDEVITALEVIRKEDETSIFERFSKLSPHAKFMAIAILGLFVDFLVNIFSAYAFEYIKKELNLFPSQELKQIKKLNLPIDTTYYRFTTAEILNVRSKPSTTKSDIIGQLKMGSIVEIIDKKRNWIKVLYKQGDVSIKGWVFTRYTRKFKN
ncbi:MAG: Unknown protein [uncultured Sulfurovum sp.]|uniref:SH3b domain-containing protein n=1 Tax=uncultured Sulfurovum sp. TaxID=269237 RepID=A0A6S6T0D2_9BACT|nr:MAG: Unknown protein [uncultured Sulfurovum sp.]